MERVNIFKDAINKGQRKENMTILESLREKRKEQEIAIGGSYDENELFDIMNQYDLALENALLKLKNRGVEIKDLKHRLGDINA